MPSNPPDYMKTHRAAAKARGVRRVSVTMHPDEYATLQADAIRHGIRPTAHLKALAFAHIESAYLVPSDMAERMETLLGILRGIGNNLNQLARHSNEMKYFLDTDSVRLQVKRMDEAVRVFVTRPPLDERPA